MPKKRTPRQRRQAQQRARTRRRRQADAQAYQSAMDRIAAEHGAAAGSIPPAWIARGPTGPRWEGGAGHESDFDPDADGAWDDDQDNGYWEEYEGEECRMMVVEKVLCDTVAAILKAGSAWPARRLDEVFAESSDGDSLEEWEDAATVVLLSWLFRTHLWFGPEQGGEVADAAVAWVDEHLGAEEVDQVMPVARWLGDPASRLSYDSPSDEVLAALLPAVPLFAGLAATAGAGDPGWLDRLDFDRRESTETHRSGG